MIDYGMLPQEAVDAPRIHQQWLPDVLYAEPFALSPTPAPCSSRWAITSRSRNPAGAVALIASGAIPRSEPKAIGADTVTPQAVEPGVFFGASDPRHPAGAALAP